MTDVKIPTPLTRFTKNKSVVKVGGRTIAELIQNLEMDYPGLKKRLCEENGEIRKFINIYVDGEDIRSLKGMETEIKEGGEVSIIPAIAGG